MAEIKAHGAARAVIGPASVATEADVTVVTVLLGLAVILAALVISWAAETRAPGPKWWVHQMTEWEGPAQDFQEHLADAAELVTAPVFAPAIYPARTAPGITATMHQGFHQAAWQTTDRDIAERGRTVPW